MFSRKANSTQWPMFRSAREYMQTSAIFFLNFAWYSAHIYWNIYLQKIYIGCRRKLHSIKLQRSEGVHLKHWWKISICLYLSFLGVWRNLKNQDFAPNTTGLIGPPAARCATRDASRRTPLGKSCQQACRQPQFWQWYV